MKFVLTVGDQSRTLDWDHMPLPDAIECERVTGWTYHEWRKALIEDKAQAVAYAWWLAGKREGVDVGRFADALKDETLDLGALSIEVIPDEEPEAQPAGDAEGPTGPEQEATPGD